MNKYIYMAIDLIAFVFVLVNMTVSAKNQDICWTMAWGVIVLGVWMGILVKLSQ